MDNPKFYRFLNEKSILVINKDNQLRRLNCPFVAKDKKGKLKRVTAVASKTGTDIKYLIDGIYKPYKAFIIVY